MPLKFATARSRALIASLISVMAFVAGSTRARVNPGQKEPEVKIISPVTDKAARRVTLPGGFWNSQTAAWVEVAFCGRPSDFLHETIVCSTTTRALVEQALRGIGCHDGDAWVDAFQDFPKVRGDRFMVIVEFSRAGKKETFSLDELLTFQTADVSWNSPLGPYGFVFRGDPDHAANSMDPAGGPPLADSAKILRDDPQVALTFKQLQSISQSFADQPLAYCDDWPYETLNRGRNYAALPPAVYDSNCDIPVTITFVKVTEEQLLDQSAKLWHDPSFAAYILKQMPIAKQIDTDKAAYWNLRQELAKLKSEPPATQPDAKVKEISSHSALLMAQLSRNYAALDSAWTVWMVDHANFPAQDPKVKDAFKRQSGLWKEHMKLLAEKADMLATAEEAAGDQRDLEGMTGAANLLRVLRGKEIFARSSAMQADNKQDRDYWHDQERRLDPATDPREAWIKDVRLHVEYADAREDAAKAGLAYGQALTTPTTPDEQIARLQKDYALASVRVSIADAQIQLADVEFEISKREGLGGAAEDPDLPALKKRREALLQEIQKWRQAASQPSHMP